MAGLAWGEFAISRLAKGFVAIAAVTFASVAMMTAPAMMSQASAQSFTQALVFGDSSVDSGFYKVLGNPNGPATNKFNIAVAAAIAAGGTGAPTNSPGLMNSQVLAAHFGLTADPANQPGGTKFRDQRRQERARQHRLRRKRRICSRDSHGAADRQLPRLGERSRQWQRPLYGQFRGQ
jgi:hypothetical protein